MADERNYWVLCDDNCKFPALTKDQTIAAINSAFAKGSVSVQNSADGIIETNNNKFIQLWVGTQAEYNAIETKDDDVLYIINDDSSVEEIIATLDGLVSKSDALTTATTAVETRASDIEDDLEDISTNLTTLQGNVASYDAELGNLSDDVDELEELKSQINAGARTQLYSGSAVFNAQSTLTLSQSYENFSQIEILASTDVSSPETWNGTTILTDYIPSSSESAEAFMHYYTLNNTATTLFVGFSFTDSTHLKILITNDDPKSHNIKVFGVI